MGHPLEEADRRGSPVPAFIPAPQVTALAILSSVTAINFLFSKSLGMRSKQLIFQKQFNDIKAYRCLPSFLLLFFERQMWNTKRKKREESIFLVHIFLPPPSLPPPLPLPPPSPSSPSLSLLPAPPPPPPLLLPIHLNQNTKQTTLFSKVLGYWKKSLGTPSTQVRSNQDDKVGEKRTSSKLKSHWLLPVLTGKSRKHSLKPALWQGPTPLQHPRVITHLSDWTLKKIEGLSSEQLPFLSPSHQRDYLRNEQPGSKATPEFSEEIWLSVPK